MTRTAGRAPGLPRIIAAASIGTAFEWYDFFLFGALASVLAKHFFSSAPPAAAYLLALGTFAAAPLMRPLGALVFGRLGDRDGRKRTFLLTVLLMGGATFLIGLLPGYATIGPAAPVLLVALRLVQGLALGGEYGGAATYVAEHARPEERGRLTAWIQASAALGLIGALGASLGGRLLLGDEAFEAWGWRLPFLLSAALLALSLWMRMSLAESPVFEAMRGKGEVSRAPLREAFLRWEGMKRMLLVLAGITAAQGAVWYTAFFYTQFHLEKVLKVDPATVSLVFLCAAAASMGLYLFFGALADRVGRKPVMMFGMALAALSLFPGYAQLGRAANPALDAAARARPVVLTAPTGRCSVLFDPLGRARLESGCDIARRALADVGIGYSVEAGASVSLRVGAERLTPPEGKGQSDGALNAAKRRFAVQLSEALRREGYPAKADPADVDFPQVLALVLVFVVAASALYGPQAAWLVEMFPPRIRYSGMSLPLHIGGGWFGGLLPAVAFALVAETGDVHAGLWWPVAIAATGTLVTFFFLPETLPRRTRGATQACTPTGAA